MFLPNLTSAFGGRGDDFGNKQEHLSGNVPGGVPVATAAQLAANAQYTNNEIDHAGSAQVRRKSMVAFKNRDAGVISDPA